MISFVSGKIASKKEKYVIVKSGNLGFKVLMSQKALKSLETGKDVELFTYLVVKENALELCGFLTEGELEFFEILESIRGIGPKAALEISSLGPLERIKDRILRQDERIFEEIPGIGKKKAMAIIMELTGKIMSIKEVASEEESALTSLGFPKQKIKEALKNIPSNLKPEERIKQALKLLGK